jgi:tRNA (guanine-N7-)-methyltransferase
MRIRRKRNFNERFDLIKDYVIVAERDILNQKEAIKDKKYLDYNKIFNNDNPVSIEVGCGKGGFIIELAKKYPNKNFIAVELLDNIILMAAENAKNEDLKNLIFFNSGADYLPRYIRPNSIENIFLNFSPPYPGKSYENRRLTYAPLVEFYYNILINGGALYQKTDDIGLFEYSLENLSSKGFIVKEVSDIIESVEYLNVPTEYEKKFRNLGVKINALIAKKSL